MPPAPETHPASLLVTLRAALAAPHTCGVGLDAILASAKVRRQYSWSKKGAPEASERDSAIADWAATARLVAGGLKGLPSEVVEQRLARVDAPFAAAVKKAL